MAYVVRWKYTVQEYEDLDSIDSRTASPIQSWNPDAHPHIQKSHQHNSSIGSIASVSSLGSGSTNTPPPAPQLPLIPLPEEDGAQASVDDITLHDVLSKGNADCFSVDLSFPSAHFKANPQLQRALSAGILDQPASNPPTSSVRIQTMPDEVQEFDIPIRATRSSYVTVGDVLGQMQNFLRQPFPVDESTPESVDAVLQVFERRADTVHAGGSFKDSADREAIDKREREAGPRRIDWLLGRTRFEGLNVQGAQGCWELHLAVPERYQQ